MRMRGDASSRSISQWLLWSDATRGPHEQCGVCCETEHRDNAHSQGGFVDIPGANVVIDPQNTARGSAKEVGECGAEEAVNESKGAEVPKAGLHEPPGQDCAESEGNEH